MKKILIIAVIILGSCLAAAVTELDTMKDRYDNSVQTIKAYEAQLDSVNASTIAYKMTIDQLEHSLDSSFMEYQTIRKQLGINKKSVQTVHYISSVITKTDTLVMNDTILQPVAQSVDTVIGDEWYRLRLKMSYPDTLIFSPNFKSSQYIIAHLKKETVDPPKKWWWQRLF